VAIGSARAIHGGHEFSAIESRAAALSQMDFVAAGDAPLRVSGRDLKGNRFFQ